MKNHYLILFLSGKNVAFIVGFAAKSSTDPSVWNFARFIQNKLPQMKITSVVVTDFDGDLKMHYEAVVNIALNSLPL